jgi:RimJ/RimL family protein N-acetyltransferase
MIKQLTPADFLVWKVIRLEALQAHPLAFGGSYEEECLKNDSEWANMLKNSTIFAYLVQEQPVGIAGYFTYQEMKKRHRATLFTVYLQAAYRGQGIIDTLLTAVTDHAHQAGIEQLNLAVDAANKRAIRCYERNGFTAYGIAPKDLKIDQHYVDECLMVKFL